MNQNELLYYYQKQVDELPEMRQCVAYRCEIAVDTLVFLIDKQYSKSMDIRDLMVDCLRHFKGVVNPALVQGIIKEWQETE